MSLEIRFGTFNVGAGFVDLNHMANNNPDEQQKLAAARTEGVNNAKEDEARKIEIQTAIEEKVARALAGNLDVIALQEMQTADRTFIQTLKGLGFEFLHVTNSLHFKGFFDCAIAVRTGMFESVENLSKHSESHVEDTRLYGQEIGAIIAKVKNGATIGFSSLHSWGFQLYPKDYQHKKYDQGDYDRAGYTLTYAREAVALMKSKTTDGVVIGGDMNNNPDNFKDGFTIFENAGYKILDPKVPTNANHIDQKCGYPLRTIDFIFSSTKPLLASIWSLFFGAFTVTASEAKVLEGFDFTIDSNCSDHLPVVSTITITKEESMITRLLRALSSIFPSAR